jgi:hypothetical protein
MPSLTGIIFKKFFEQSRDGPAGAAVFLAPYLFRLNGRKTVGDFFAVMGYMAAR